MPASLFKPVLTGRWTLPPLILHPFAGREGPDKLLEGSRATLMMHGLMPRDVDMDELTRRILTGRHNEVRMLYFLGKDIFRWMDQCSEIVQKEELLKTLGIRPQSFAAMLVGQNPEFPLEGADELVRRFARALDDASPDALHDAALPLLGLGLGLTPSGDDLVGAALFARRMMASSRDDALALERVVARLVDAAHARTHVIAAALFRDLAMGESFAPLHQLAHALASGPREHAIDAARALVAVGHSSGWEMLAGFILGITRTLTPQSRTMETT